MKYTHLYEKNYGEIENGEKINYFLKFNKRQRKAFCMCRVDFGVIFLQILSSLFM